MLLTTFARNENIILRLLDIIHKTFARKYYIKIIRYYYCPRVLPQSALCRCSLLAACTLLWRRWGRKQNRTFEIISILSSVLLIIFMITLITIMILEGGKRGPMAWTSISSQANHFPFPLFLYFFFQSHSQPAIVQVNCLDQKNISFCNKFLWRLRSSPRSHKLEVAFRFKLFNFENGKTFSTSKLTHNCFHSQTGFWTPWYSSSSSLFPSLCLIPQGKLLFKRMTHKLWNRNRVDNLFSSGRKHAAPVGTTLCGSVVVVRIVNKGRKHWGEQVWEEEDRERM